MAIIQLYEAMHSGKKTFYDGNITLEQTGRIYSLLKITELFLLPGMKRTEDIDVEQFEFVCPEKEKDGKPWSSDLPYTIGIGKRMHGSWISDWTNDLDKIRHNLESYVFNEKCRLVFDYDTEETVIELTRLTTLESTEEAGSGTVYHYKDFMKVKISPGGESDATFPVVGICDQRQVIRQLYEGLLNAARSGFRFNRYRDDNDWYCSPMTFYNRIKSPIVEDYLNERTYPDDELRIHQRIIRHILTICPDYGGVLFEDEDRVCYGCVSLCDEPDLNIRISAGLVSRFFQWQKTFESRSDGINGTMGTLDSGEWNRQGMELARRLRQNLPDDIDLWYGYPYEDEENRGKRPVLLYKDYEAAEKEIALRNLSLLTQAIEDSSAEDNQEKEKSND